MRSLYFFIIKPVEDRYENTKKINNTDLILNTEMQNHQYVSRRGIVLETPINEKTGIKKGDEVILHHNVFRRFYDVRGNEKNSKNYFDDETFFVEPELVFMYKRNGEWKPVEGYCFVQPLVNDDKFSLEKEKPLTGKMVYADNSLIKNGIKPGTIVGFTPSSEYEFIIDGKRLYRVPTNSICIKYGYQGTEEEYNPVWLQSS